MKKVICTILSLTMLLSMFAGCSGDKSSSGSTTTQPNTSAVAPTAGPKEVKVALAADVASLDTRDATSTITAGVLAHMFNKLVKSDSEMKIEPDLAERYEQLDDLTWRFYLRKDATFHDGSKFTSADVVYTFDSIKDKDKKWKLATDFSFMTAKAVDEYTVDISTEEPYPGILLRLNYVMIIPKDYITKVGDEEFGKKPVGTGPYKFVDRAKDEFIVCEANENYFGGKPKIDKITFRIIPETAARLAALESGELQFATGVPSSEAPRLKSSGLNVVDYFTSRVYYLNFNTLVDGPLKDARVRQAINYAIDRDLIINGVLDGFATKIASLACPQYDGYDAAIKGYETNKDKAKTLLAEAGYPEGFSIAASYSQSTPNSADVMQFIAAQLGEVGIKVELHETESNKQREMITAGTIEPIYFNAIGGPYANIDLQAKLVFTTDERYSTYSNPEFDALRLKAASAVDKTERDKLNSQLQQMIIDQAAAAVLYQSSAIYATSSKLLNWQARTDEMLLFYDCDIA